MLELAMYTVNHVLYRLNLYTFLSVVGPYAHEVKFFHTPLNLSKHLRILLWLVLLLIYWPVILR
jgi:hypothetical protein